VEAEDRLLPTDAVLGQKVRMLVGIAGGGVVILRLAIAWLLALPSREPTTAPGCLRRLQAGFRRLSCLILGWAKKRHSPKTEGPLRAIKRIPLEIEALSDRVKSSWPRTKSGPFAPTKPLSGHLFEPDRSAKELSFSTRRTALRRAIQRPVRGRGSDPIAGSVRRENEAVLEVEEIQRGSQGPIGWRSEKGRR